MKNFRLHSWMTKDEKLQKDEGQMANNKPNKRTSMAYVDNKTVITKLNKNNSILTEWKNLFEYRKEAFHLLILILSSLSFTLCNLYFFFNLVHSI